MSKVDLSSFQSAANKTHGDYVVTANGEDLLFRNALRLSKGDRKAFRLSLDLAARHKADADFESSDGYRDAFRVSAATPADFEKLEAAIGDDVIVWTDLFTDFATETLSEKASASED